MPVVPCVRTARERGEEVRAAIAERDLLDHGHEITVEDGWLYIPITDPEAVTEDRESYEVVEREVETRRTRRTPADILGFSPTYERLGDVVLLTEEDPERAAAIAEAVIASDLPVETVLRRASKVAGEHRTREWELLAGESTETTYREYGCEYRLDVREIYFSPRLATDRHLVAERVSAGERAIDMFAGVGPFVVPFAKRGAQVVGVDLNPAAIAYLGENAYRNGVADRVRAIEGDVREVAPEFENWADRLVMNLPHSAAEFLDAAVELASKECVIHYYDIQHESAPFEPGEEAIAAAAKRAGYRTTIEKRRRVRSYAPHELNVRLDARLRRPHGSEEDRNPN
jgi:tRNA (guanine37-N1)-methyltransferase